MNKAQRKKVRRQIRLQKKSGYQKAKKWRGGNFTHTLVIAGYHNEDGDLARLSGVLTKMDVKNKCDEVLENGEAWLDLTLTEEKANKIASNQLMGWMETVTEKYDLGPEILYVTQVDGTAPLQKCDACECDSYLNISIGYNYFLED